MKRFVTIVTPTYNRGEMLPDLYVSLCNQTDKGFQWLVIDDGSTDDTEQKIKEFRNHGQLLIEYVKKRNGGKHTALNMAFKLIDTELTFIVDSDDVLAPDAVQQIHRRMGRIKDASFAGISFLKGDAASHTIVGSRFVKGHEISNDIDMRFRDRVKGDKAEVWKTAVLRKYRFPVFEEEHFQGENYIWWQIARDYKMLYVNRVIYLCEYLPDGLTRQGRKLRLLNPRGGMENCRVALYPEFPAVIRAKYSLLYVVYYFMDGRNVKKLKRDLGAGRMVLYYLPGFLLYQYWKRKYLG